MYLPFCFFLMKSSIWLKTQATMAPSSPLPKKAGVSGEKKNESCPVNQI